MFPNRRSDSAETFGFSSDRWEHISAALVFFFEHRRATDPEGLAQETLVRVIVKLSGGQTIEGESGLEKFCYACAGYVMQENRRERVGEELPATIAAPTTKTLGLNQLEFALLARELLNALDEDERQLAHHAIEGTLEELARQRKQPIERLRVQTARLRAKLRRIRDGGGVKS